MQDATVFWDNVSEKYARAPISNEEAYLYTLNKTRGYLTPDDNILEVGCGTGSTALLLAKNVHQITASDLSGKMIEIARAKAKAEGISNVEFVQEDVLDSSFSAKPFDAVLAHNMLHLLEDIPAAIQTIGQRLKPGGVFISKTVCKFGSGTSLKWRLMKVILPLMQMLGKAPYVNFMDAAELENLIESGGFEIIESGNYPTGHMSRYIVARKV